MGCYNTTVVSAPVDQVWAALRNFHDLSWAAGVIERVDVVGDRTADQVGAKRVLNGAFHETLLALDDAEHSLKYSIDDGPGPVAKDRVTGYVGAVRVWPVTDTGATFVEWSSSWATSQGGVAEFCSPVYQALLSALKAHFGHAARG